MRPKLLQTSRISAALDLSYIRAVERRECMHDVRRRCFFVANNTRTSSVTRANADWAGPLFRSAVNQISERFYSICAEPLWRDYLDVGEVLIEASRRRIHIYQLWSYVALRLHAIALRCAAIWARYVDGNVINPAGIQRRCTGRLYAVAVIICHRTGNSGAP